MASVVLAYSGSVSTTCAIHWLKNKKNLNVITVAANFGQRDNPEMLAEKALSMGAKAAHVVDLRKKYVYDFILPTLQAGAVYEAHSFLGAALTRPLIASAMVAIAEKERAKFAAHCSVKKGNDQARLELSLYTLNPDLEVISPPREWDMSGYQDYKKYAEKHGFEIPESQKKQERVHVDINLWGSNIQTVAADDPWEKGSYDIWQMTKSYAEAPDEPAQVEIAFENGVPCKLNGKVRTFEEIIIQLNELAGTHGIGRYDAIEGRLLGFKARDFYEAPAATVLHKARHELETLTLSRNVLQIRKVLGDEYARLIYTGMWFSELRKAIDCFFHSFQKYISGDVRMHFYKGNCVVVGRRSKYSQYDVEAATAAERANIGRNAAVGFIEVQKVPAKAESRVRKLYYEATGERNPDISLPFEP